MTDSQKFGTKLRELRTNAGLTLRELGEKVNVNFTYLSKIESGTLPPPSEKVIRQLAEVLNTDQDDLLTLAGIIPPDIAEILKDHKLRERLRAEKSRKEAVATAKRIISIPKVSLPLKGLYRLALPVFLVIAVAASLWFASPTQALLIEYPNQPQSGTLGYTYTFYVKVSIEDTELLPIQQVNVIIYNVDDPTTYKATLADLPLGDSSTSTHNPSEGTGSGTATVSASADSHWGYATSGAGYVYVLWESTGYTFAPVVGGYGYQTGTGTTSITYTITWTSPSDWLAGNYRIDTELVTSPRSPGGGTTFTKTSNSFTLSTMDTAGFASGVAEEEEEEEVVEVTEVVVDISENIDPETGKFNTDVNITSGDGNVELDITTDDRRPVTEEGVPIDEITITEMEDPPELPADSNRIALPYDLGPDGAQFPDGIALTLHFDPDTVGDGALVISYHDGTAWVDLSGPFQIDLVNGTITTTIYHFTPFTILEYTSPASFAVSDLTISPAEVDPGEEISISATISNTGGLSGTYDVVLMIDDSVTATESVTIAGRESQTVTFSTTLNIAGTYTISIDEASGVVTVKAPEPVEPEPVEPEPVEPVEPEPVEPVEPEPVEPVEPEPVEPVEPEPVEPLEPEPEAETNWWLIGGIVVVIIIAVVVWLLVIRRRG